MKRNRKWKIRHIVFDGRILCFSWYKNRKLKVKMWWVGACERKKRAFFVPLILSEGNFLNICVLSQCIVNWIHFPNIYAFIYQKTLLHTLSWLFLKSTKYLQFILTFVQFQSKMKWRAELLTIMALYLSMNILTHQNIYCHTWRFENGILLRAVFLQILTLWNLNFTWKVQKEFNEWNHSKFWFE